MTNYEYLAAKRELIREARDRCIANGSDAAIIWICQDYLLTKKMNEMNVEVACEQIHNGGTR